MSLIFVRAPGVPLEALGFIPRFLDALDRRTAAAQFAERYAFGGGWQPMAGWQKIPSRDAICYPGDPPLEPIAWAELRHERVLIYPGAWVAIVQPDGAYQVSRLD